jgi:hypothetical protein
MVDCFRIYCAIYQHRVYMYIYNHIYTPAMLMFNRIVVTLSKKGAGHKLLKPRPRKDRRWGGGWVLCSKNISSKNETAKGGGARLVNPDIAGTVAGGKRWSQAYGRPSGGARIPKRH